MMIYDCFSLLLDVEQMKLSTTAVKDTEEVQKWKEIPFLLYQHTQTMIIFKVSVEKIKERMFCDCG